MADESFMMLSLKENQSKKLAQVISNETARKILDYLTEHDYATETKIAKELELPLSTVHYNMKALVESKLVLAEEYHYSEKGKEVPHYKLAKKFIIIAPKEDQSVMERLKKFWPITAIAVGVGAIITFAQYLSRSGASFMAENVDLSKGAMRTAAESPEAADAVIAGGEVLSQEAAFAGNETARQVAPVLLQQDPSPWFAGGWFVAGALFVVVLALIWGLWQRKK